ncbi:MAG: DUF3788 domain-containing protein [Methanomassiliicoccaceae archaeon]|nr:DUF3788 domain-containing protein [Methanomassiliicoccaceae archaeon]
MSNGEEHMSLSAFGDKGVMPDDHAVSSALGANKQLWDEIKDHAASYNDMNEEWKFYSKAAGWTLLIRSGKRTLFYMMPMNGLFRVSFVFGGKAADEAQRSDLPDALINTITTAKQYAEGRSFMTDVKEKDDVSTVIRLIAIKDAN